MDDGISTVLVVDDDDSIRNLIRTLLRLGGYEAIACQDAEEAVDLLRVRGGDIRLMIADVNLGSDMDGIELAESLRASFPSMKTLYISGRVDEARLALEVESGRAFFLMKPFRPREFTDLVKAILSGSEASAQPGSLTIAPLSQSSATVSQPSAPASLSSAALSQSSAALSQASARISRT